jgi:hypothetical protein
LGLDIRIEGIDLFKLLQEKPLTIASQIAANKYAISLFSLIDTRVNSSIFIN